MPFQVEGLARGLAEKAECGEKDVSMQSDVTLYLVDLRHRLGWSFPTNPTTVQQSESVPPIWIPRSDP